MGRRYDEGSSPTSSQKVMYPEDPPKLSSAYIFQFSKEAAWMER